MRLNIKFLGDRDGMKKYQAQFLKNDRIELRLMRQRFFFTQCLFFSQRLFLSNRYLFIVCIGLYAGCSNRALVKGALTPTERQEYVEQTGALIPQRLRDSFVAGNAATGMTKEMIAFIYGQPDRTENNRYGITWGNGEAEVVPVLDYRSSRYAIPWGYLGTNHRRRKPIINRRPP
jgi:hypothetical protein